MSRLRNAIAIRAIVCFIPHYEYRDNLWKTNVYIMNQNFTSFPTSAGNFRNHRISTWHLRTMHIYKYSKRKTDINADKIDGEKIWRNIEIIIWKAELLGIYRKLSKFNKIYPLFFRLLNIDSKTTIRLVVENERFNWMKISLLEIKRIPFWDSCEVQVMSAKS